MGTRINTKKRNITQAAEIVVQSLESRRMLSATLDEGTWTIELDDNKSHTIKIDYAPKNADKLRALIDGKVIATASISEIDYIEIYGGAGNDKIIIDAN